MNTRSSSPFPFSSMIALCMALICHGYAITSLYPYVGYMVLSFGVTDDKDKSGFFAGYITGAFMAGRFVSSYYWGHWSDIHGRKPTLYIGIISNLIFSTLFGFSTSVWFAIISRFCLGFFDGIVSTCKVSVSEICGKEHEVKGMGIITGCWSLSYVLGPVVSGVLADPCTQYPSIFGNSVLFQKFPYLLPNLVASTLATVALIAVYTHVPETAFPIKSADIISTVISENTEKNILFAKFWQKCNNNRSKNLTLGTSSERDLRRCTCQKTDFKINKCNEVSRLLENGMKDGKTGCNGHQKDDLVQMDDDVEYHIVGNSSKDYGSNAKVEESSMLENLSRMLSIPTARYILLFYMVLSILVGIFDEAYPLWALSTIQKGGLDWTSGTIGKVLSISGVFMALFQFIVYPLLAHSIGYVRMQNVASILAIPLYVTFPYTSLLHNRPSYLGIVLVFNMILVKAVSNTLFTSVTLITNNSVPTDLRGGLNGVAMTLGSLAKTIGTTAGSILFAYSISDQMTIPLVDYHFTFNVCALLSVVFAVGSWTCFSEDTPSNLQNKCIQK